MPANLRKTTAAHNSGWTRNCTTFGSAAFYQWLGFAFDGTGTYEDDEFFVVVSKAGRVECRTHKQYFNWQEPTSRIGNYKPPSKIKDSNLLPHQSAIDFFGSQFHGIWYLKG